MWLLTRMTSNNEVSATLEFICGLTLITHPSVPAGQYKQNKSSVNCRIDRIGLRVIINFNQVIFNYCCSWLPSTEASQRCQKQTAIIKPSPSDLPSSKWNVIDRCVEISDLKGDRKAGVGRLSLHCKSSRNVVIRVACRGDSVVRECLPEQVNPCHFRIAAASHTIVIMLLLCSRLHLDAKFLDHPTVYQFSLPLQLPAAVILHTQNMFPSLEPGGCATAALSLCNDAVTTGARG